MYYKSQRRFRTHTHFVEFCCFILSDSGALTCAAILHVFKSSIKNLNCIRLSQNLCFQLFKLTFNIIKIEKKLHKLLVVGPLKLKISNLHHYEILLIKKLKQKTYRYNIFSRYYICH